MKVTITIEEGSSPVEVVAYPSISKLEPIEFLLIEGGFWIPWNERMNDLFHRVGGGTVARTGPLLHAIKFSDGSIFDYVNGWRK